MKDNPVVYVVQTVSGRVLEVFYQEGDAKQFVVSQFDYWGDLSITRIQTK